MSSSRVFLVQRFSFHIYVVRYIYLFIKFQTWKVVGKMHNIYLCWILNKNSIEAAVDSEFWPAMENFVSPSQNTTTTKNLVEM